MKITLLTTLLGIALTSNGLLAQNVTQNVTKSKNPNTPNWVISEAEKLPENLREGFFKAYKQINSDPKVRELQNAMQEVNQKYTKTIKESMQKIEPKLAEALHTISDPKAHENLRESFFKSYKQINSDPEVLELRKAMKAVSQKYTKTIKERIQKMDPTLARALQPLQTAISEAYDGLIKLRL